MALGSTQPLTEMRKADKIPQLYAVVMKSGNLNFMEPSGPITGLLTHCIVKVSMKVTKLKLICPRL
jgi:hypothetical protein